MNGWEDIVDPDLKHYAARKTELTVHQGCHLWGMRVIIPPKLRRDLLSELHQGHIGVVKMKAVALSYMWWPGLDQDIELMCKTCAGCQEVKHATPGARLHPWEWPSRPWHRVHIDFAGPFLDSMFLIAVDAHSKWPEVVQMKSTTAERTIEVLRTIFARNGVPRQIVSDNGPQFKSELFHNFMRLNGIKHITSAPYHPSTNGSLNAAERNYSQIDKEALGLVWGVKHFHDYLFGRRFTLLTDHKPLVAIFNPEKSIPTTTASRMQRYALFLSGLTYDIEYKHTKAHGNAD
ncbi:uncharacterized protein K02A2.6-like, partial [Mizuhopecten yessoensis]|uniref:uncharacterized protein K02A2.6-like n=1 Tax=Mizuhopecten yessoensis TaxID=6573 RepID=UPI000B45AC64